MYKVINIDGVDYKLEFSIEASLYHDCIEQITNFMYTIDSAGNTNDLSGLISGISNLPMTAVTCFYAGLMEHHGVDGDGLVTSIGIAKKLAASLIKSEDSEIKNWYDLFNLCIEQMGEDGFFDLIGLTEMTSTEKKAPKVPQDHKRKTRAIAK